MISCDTNLFIHAYNLNSPFHQAERDFFINYSSNRELVELYVLLRNPAVVERPLNGQKAIQVCRQYRANKNWMVIDYPGYLMKEVW